MWQHWRALSCVAPRLRRHGWRGAPLPRSENAVAFHTSLCRHGSSIGLLQRSPSLSLLLFSLSLFLSLYLFLVFSPCFVMICMACFPSDGSSETCGVTHGLLAACAGSTGRMLGQSSSARSSSQADSHRTHRLGRSLPTRPMCCSNLLLERMCVCNMCECVCVACSGGRCGEGVGVTGGVSAASAQRRP